ncbi:MAG TPA: rhomboid family intramembrane serine protease [Candidatus Sulfotelmatobacter sp.]|nr:rhomboid family intramembrane serine protease [Candidatus Sulfotelmatobacter sp.]HWI58107.1 rhomboid family intramembrane serine protease [Bacillota bacterium]
MRTLWHRFLAPLTPGVRFLLVVLTAMALATFLGDFSHAYDLSQWLALSGPDFWTGMIWPILTYALLPATLFDFLFNWLVLLFLGSLLERVWSRTQFWTFCLVATLGAGLAKVLAQPSTPSLLVGTTPMVFGLLVAWGWLFGHEKVLFFFIWEMTARQAAVAMILIAFLTMLPCAGLVNSAIMLCGGLAGWIYLWLQSKLLGARRSQTTTSERMGRLEL